MRYLGIDYGKKKVGLAVSEGISASPFKVIEISSLIDALQQVRQIIKREEIDRVVLGLSESGESRKITENFIRELKKEIEVVVVEETLSSRLADQHMREMDMAKSKLGKNDAVAATIILQDYLDLQR